LDDTFSGAARQQTSETRVAMPADNNKIGTHLFGGAHDLLVWISLRASAAGLPTPPARIFSVIIYGVAPSHLQLICDCCCHSHRVPMRRISEDGEPCVGEKDLGLAPFTFQ
jgi:hypothetical protein